MKIPINFLGRIGHTGDSPVMAYNRAMIFLKHDSFEDAITDLNKAISLDSNFLDAYEKRGYCYYRKGMFSEALQDYFRVYEKRQDNVSLILHIIDTHRRAGNFEEAINMAYAAMFIEPLNSQLYLFRGCSFFDSGKIEFALSDFLASIALNPNGSSAVYHIANCLGKLNKPNESINYYTNYINDFNGIYIDFAYYQRGLQYNIIGDFENFKNDIIKSDELGLEAARDTRSRMDF